MKTDLQNAIAWLVKSSADPSQVALTFKAFAVGLVPAFMFLIGVGHINVDSSGLNTIINDGGSFVQALLTIVAAVMATIGIARKLYFELPFHSQPPVNEG